MGERLTRLARNRPSSAGNADRAPSTRRTGRDGDCAYGQLTVEGELGGQTNSATAPPVTEIAPAGVESSHQTV